MEWRKYFKGGYRSACGRWSAQATRTGWRLDRLDAPRPHGRWVTVSFHRSLRECKETARKADGA